MEAQREEMIALQAPQRGREGPRPRPLWSAPCASVWQQPGSVLLLLCRLSQVPSAHGPCCHPRAQTSRGPWLL